MKLLAFVVLAVLLSITVPVLVSTTPAVAWADEGGGDE